jgi:synaptobrevin homolog YKT6
MKLIALHIFKW